MTLTKKQYEEIITRAEDAAIQGENLTHSLATVCLRVAKAILAQDREVMVREGQKTLEIYRGLEKVYKELADYHEVLVQHWESGGLAGIDRETGVPRLEN